MTTHELARLLLAARDVRVLVRGYEYGYEDVAPERVCEALVYVDANNWVDGEPRYCGPHDVVSESEARVLRVTTEPCVVIDRRS